MSQEKGLSRGADSHMRANSSMSLLVCQHWLVVAAQRKTGRGRDEKNPDAHVLFGQGPVVSPRPREMMGKGRGWGEAKMRNAKTLNEEPTSNTVAHENTKYRREGRERGRRHVGVCGRARQGDVGIFPGAREWWREIRHTHASTHSPPPTHLYPYPTQRRKRSVNRLTTLDSLGVRRRRGLGYPHFFFFHSLSFLNAILVSLWVDPFQLGRRTRALIAGP